MGPTTQGHLRARVGGRRSRRPSGRPSQGSFQLYLACFHSSNEHSFPSLIDSRNMMVTIMRQISAKRGLLEEHWATSVIFVKHTRWCTFEAHDLGEPTHPLVPCWMRKPLPPRNECMGWFVSTKDSWPYVNRMIWSPSPRRSVTLCHTWTRLMTGHNII